MLHTIGIDLGKTVFHLVGLSPRGEVVVRKKFSRKQLLHFTANLQVELIGMEACGGSHFLGRALREQGHEVRLMPAQYVTHLKCVAWTSPGLSANKTSGYSGVDDFLPGLLAIPTCARTGIRGRLHSRPGQAHTKSFNLIDTLAVGVPDSEKL